MHSKLFKIGTAFPSGLMTSYAGLRNCDMSLTPPCSD